MRIVSRSLVSACGMCLVLGVSGCGKESPPPATAPSGSPSTADTAGIAPSLGTVTPASGSGKAQMFTATYSHPGGAKSVVSAWMLIERTLTGKNACFVEYLSGQNKVNLMDDSGKWLGGLPAGTRGALSNSQCSVDAAGVKATSEGNTLTVTFPITFTNAYTGPKTIYLLASGPKVGAQWTQKGTWTVQ
jgi:hypothetical protein